jgi:zinc transport system substrate-binding protein
MGIATGPLFAALLLLACSPARDDATPERGVAADDGPLRIYTVNYPLQYFAERIGGEFVSVVFPVPAGIDPAYWSPEPEQVAAFQTADLILRNGAGYAAWVDRSSFSRRKLVDTSAGFRARLLPLDRAVVHTHGPEGDHTRSDTAFTTWLDPRLAASQARAIAEALARSRPSRRDVFMENLETLEHDLERLDQKLEAIAERLGQRPLVFSHPVYPYLERRYGLNGHSLHWEPDRIPDPEMWQELEALLETHPARLMLWEAEPKAETQRRLEALGLATVVYAPGAQRPEAGDWLDAMESNAARLEANEPGVDAPER